MIRTLVAEDNEMLRILLEIQLRKLGECDFAADGFEACALFAKALDKGRPYRLILMDVQMPGMDGVEAIKRIKALEEARGIPTADRIRIVIQSAYPDLIERDPIVDGFLTKPYNSYDLLKTIQSLMLPSG